ncbi:3-keto-disaccharide hydrolase [Tautonia sociabilis]|uniref:DUF1080 domain-containing protein n=1 Tax=Tautonia sociabilis TaxID=2080755 RepID=A0A432MII9_9BACT|nr:DUF1080 domain-containing protein [Tautonia sociabilis]
MTCIGIAGLLAISPAFAWADEPAEAPKAIIDGTEPGWRALGADDFENVNTDPDTWTFEGDLIRCTGQPVGVTRTKQPVTNFELVVRWRHLKPAGNSGIFVWSPAEALEGIERGRLPRGGIEVQVLDNAFTQHYEQHSGKKGDWFTTHGDVFPVGTSTMSPFEPTSPDGSRSFPTENRCLDTGEWNHYYIRAINGEIRLWVNGKEVSGGQACNPSSGYLCLESEGSPIEFQGLRIRELP